MADFTNGICGCFNNCGITVMTYACPCYISGKTAESVGKSCAVFGLLSLCPPIGTVTDAMVRGAVREKYNIDGSFIGDLLCHCCCPCCAIVQNAAEVTARGDAPPGACCMSRD